MNNILKEIIQLINKFIYESGCYEFFLHFIILNLIKKFLENYLCYILAMI
jgi:hypothetical protein